MMKEDYVSWDTAKLLKEKGFDEYCLKNYWESDKELHNWTWELSYGKNSQNNTCCKDCAAPTLQMAMKYLREKKNILISVNPTVDKDGFACLVYYIWDIDDIEKKAITSGLYSIEGYNECIEAAIKYCLENLI